MPAMVRREGWQVLVVPVTHAERRSGRSKYNNLQRALVGAIDLLGAAWLIRRRRLPEADAPSAVTMPPERPGDRPPEAAAPPSSAVSETVRWNAPPAVAHVAADGHIGRDHAAERHRRGGSGFSVSVLGVLIIMLGPCYARLVAPADRFAFAALRQIRR